jgi:chromosome segregation ATPase
VPLSSSLHPPFNVLDDFQDLQSSANNNDRSVADNLAYLCSRKRLCVPPWLGIELTFRTKYSADYTQISDSNTTKSYIASSNVTSPYSSPNTSFESNPKTNATPQTDELSSYNGYITTLHLLLDEERTKAAKAESEASEALRANEDLQAENCRLQLEIEQVFKTRAKAKQARDLLKMEIAICHDECEMEREEASKALAQVDEVKQEMAELEDRHKVKAKCLEDITRSLEAGIDQRDHMIRAIYLDLDKQYGLAEQLSEELAEAHVQINNFDKVEHKLADELAEARGRITNLEKNNKALKKTNRVYKQRENVFEEKEKELLRKIEEVTADAEDKERFRNLEAQNLRQQRRKAEHDQKEAILEMEKLRAAKEQLEKQEKTLRTALEEKLSRDDGGG